MASMNTNNNEVLCCCAAAALPPLCSWEICDAAAPKPLASYHDDDFEEDDPIVFNGEPLRVQITNDSFGQTSIKQTVNGLMRCGYSVKYVEQLELAQLMCQGDDRGSEFDLIQGIINSSKKSPRLQKDQENRCKIDSIRNEVMEAAAAKTRHKREEAMIKQKQTVIAEQAEKQATKNAKRNAKRRAKAKKTKETLNFTPTKEQEEWFWGGAPHGGTEYGSDGFPTDEEYDRKEIELGGPAIHCGGGRWKLG